MIPYNNCDELLIVKLSIIIKILQQSSYSKNINKISKKSTANVKHKNNINSNNLSAKKNAKDKINTEYKLPIQEVNIEDNTNCISPLQELNIEDNTNCIPPLQELNIEDDINCIPPLQEVNIEDNTNCIPPLQELNIEDDINCIKENIENKDEINNNTTTNGIYEIPKNISTNHNENFISTLPILIAKKNIDIPIESTFKFKNATLDIKNMKKSIYITNSKVLPMY